MHHIHHTKGIILSSRNVGEANKVLNIYTRELGLVRATAQGVRLARSRLRYTLTDFSYANIDLVRGKEVWRVTSARSLNSFPFARANNESILFIARSFAIVERLCIGEEPNEKVFDALIFALHTLDVESVTKEEREALELHTILSIVYELGYVGESDLLSEYLGKDFEPKNTETILNNRRSIVAHINKALRESQL